MRENKAILIVGIGGLGAPAALAIARAHAATALGLIDPDPVELTNLHRQVIYGGSDIGRSKVEAAARHLCDIDPTLGIEAFPFALDNDNASRLLSRFDFIVDGTDSPETKFLINDVAVAASKPFVYGGVLGTSGQVMTVLPGETACIRCLFEEAPDAAEVASCREAGILGPIAGAIGNLQAREALAVVSGRETEFSGGILTYDAAGPARVRFTKVNPRPGCLCGASDRVSKGQPAGHVQVNN